MRPLSTWWCYKHSSPTSMRHRSLIFSLRWVSRARRSGWELHLGLLLSNLLMSPWLKVMSRSSSHPHPHPSRLPRIGWASCNGKIGVNKEIQIGGIILCPRRWSTINEWDMVFKIILCIQHTKGWPQCKWILQISTYSTAYDSCA